MTTITASKDDILAPYIEDIAKYQRMYQEEKFRADLLQDDLNSVDILHYDECAGLNAKIALLEQKLKLKGCH